MMGPISSLSSMIETVNERISETLTMTDRLRTANCHLTGSDGRPPTPLGAQQGEVSGKPQNAEIPPLMVRLTIALNHLSEAQADLRLEVDYLEQHSETGAPTEAKLPGSYKGGADTVPAARQW